MSEQMVFPETFEKFAKEYGFKDDKEVYTNGSELIPVFRVKQWFEHDNKLRAIEIDTAYECGKHANYRGCIDCVLDKIRAEIAKIPKKYPMTMDYENGLKEAIGIIDKYKVESEEEYVRK